MIVTAVVKHTAGEVGPIPANFWPNTQVLEWLIVQPDRDGRENSSLRSAADRDDAQVVVVPCNLGTNASRTALGDVIEQVLVQAIRFGVVRVPGIVKRAIVLPD